MGSLYRRGNVWWMKYYQNGRAIRESTGSTKQVTAKQILKEREGRLATGQPILRRIDRISYKEVAQDLRQHYQTTGLRNLTEAGYRLKHLDALFTDGRIVTIGPSEITAYVAKRQEEGAANVTINRGLETLKRCCGLPTRITSYCGCLSSTSWQRIPRGRGSLSLIKRLSIVSFALTVNSQ